MSASSIPPYKSDISPDIITKFNRFTVSELKKLTPKKVNEIISHLSKNSPTLNEDDYKVFGQRFHLIPTSASIHLYKWFITKITAINDITVTLNSMKRGCLSNLMEADFRPVDTMFKDKRVKRYLKFQDKVLQESIKQEVVLLFENASQFKNWMKSPNRMQTLNEVNANCEPISDKTLKKVREKYGEECLTYFQYYISNKTNRLLRLAWSTVYFNKAQNEKQNVADFLMTLDKAHEDDEIKQALNAIYSQIQNIKENESTYLSLPCNFDYRSRFRDEDCDVLWRVINNEELSPNEKRVIVKMQLEEIDRNLETLLTKADNRIKLLQNERCTDHQESLVDRFKKCISVDEAIFYQEAMDILNEISTLHSTIGTRDAFLTKISTLSQNMEGLQTLENELSTLVVRAGRLEKKARELTQKLSDMEIYENTWESEYKDYWKDFLTKHIYDAKLTMRSADLIEILLHEQDKLTPDLINELNVVRRLELMAELENALTNQIPIKFKQVIALRSDLSPTELKEDEWGIHQKAKWQLKQVKDRIHHLRLSSPSIAGSSNDAFEGTTSQTVINSEEEAEDIVTKIAELGIDGNMLEKPPFNISKPLYFDEEQGVLKVDWNKYAEIFIGKGIRYDQIKNINSIAEFQHFYTTIAPSIQ